MENRVCKSKIIFSRNKPLVDVFFSKKKWYKHVTLPRALLPKKKNSYICCKSHESYVKCEVSASIQKEHSSRTTDPLIFETGVCEPKILLDCFLERASAIAFCVFALFLSGVHLGITAYKPESQIIIGIVVLVICFLYSSHLRSSKKEWKEGSHDLVSS